MNFEELKETLTPPPEAMKQTYVNVKIISVQFYPDGPQGPSIGIEARGMDDVVRSHWLFRHSLPWIPKAMPAEDANKCMAKFAENLRYRKTPFKLLAYDSQLQVPKSVPEVGTLSEGRPLAAPPLDGLPTPSSRILP